MNTSIAQRWGAYGAAAALLLTTVVTSVSPASAAAPTQPEDRVRAAVVSPAPQAELCQLALSKIELYRNTSGFVAPDQLTLLDQTITVDLANLNLFQTPFDSDSSRKMWYRSMLWLAVAAVDAGERGDTATADTYAQHMITAAQKYPDPGSATPFNLAWSLVLGWDAGTVIRRSQALLCLSSYTGVEPVRALLRMHADALVDSERYGGPPKRRVSNAGAFANLTLLEISKALNEPEYRRIAVERLLNDNAAAFDAAGWSNEAAAHYQSVNIRLWRDVQTELRARGNNAEADAMEPRLAQATRLAAQLIGPAGQLATIGNTRPDDAVLRPGSAGLPLQVVNAAGGLAIGRWSFSDVKTTWYTLQNRLVKGAHGHEDNLSLTWATDGLQILADPGQHDYDRVTNPITIWSMSPEAHNRSVPNTVSKDRAKVRSLKVVRRGSVDDASMFSSDLGSIQARRVLIDNKRQSIEVGDVASMGQTQYWHLGQGWQEKSSSTTEVVLRHTKGKELHVSSPDGALSVVPASLNPIAGLLVTGFEVAVPSIELRVKGGSGLTTVMTLVNPRKPRPTTPEISRDSTAGNKSVELLWADPRVANTKPKSKQQATARQKTAKITSYRVQAFDKNTGWRTVIKDTKSAASKQRVRGLTNGTAYRFRVAPLTKDTVGTYSEPSKWYVPTAAPGPILDPSAESAGKKRVTVSWTAPEDDGGASVRYYEVSVPDRKEPITAKRPSVTLPFDGKRTTVTVAAVNRTGTGPVARLTVFATKDGTLKVRS